MVLCIKRRECTYLHTKSPMLCCSCCVFAVCVCAEMTYFKYLADLEPVEVCMMIGTCMDSAIKTLQVGGCSGRRDCKGRNGGATGIKVMHMGCSCHAVRPGWLLMLCFVCCRSMAAWLRVFLSSTADGAVCQEPPAMFGWLAD